MIQPSFHAASRCRKGRTALVQKAIKLIKNNNIPEALGCLIAYEKRRQDENRLQGQD